MIEDPRLNKNKVLVPRRDNLWEKTHSFCYHPSRHQEYTCSHVRAYRNVCQSCCRWGVIYRPDWNAGASWTWGVRGDEEQHTGPPGEHTGPTYSDTVTAAGSYWYRASATNSYGDSVGIKVVKVDVEWIVYKLKHHPTITTGTIFRMFTFMVNGKWLKNNPLKQTPSSPLCIPH